MSVRIDYEFHLWKPFLYNSKLGFFSGGVRGRHGTSPGKRRFCAFGVRLQFVNFVLQVATDIQFYSSLLGNRGTANDEDTGGSWKKQAQEPSMFLSWL